MGEDQEHDQEQEQGYDEKGHDGDDVSEDDDNPTADLPPSPASAAAAAASAALTVIVPGGTALFREQGRLDVSWGSSVTSPPEGTLCGCVSVLDDKGALEFNSEDVAALLVLALGRVHPFAPLAARIAAAAAAEGEAGWDGAAARDDVDDEDGGGGGGDTLDARVWTAVQQYTLECRAASSSSAAAAAAAASASPANLFASPVSGGATPAQPVSRSAGQPAGPVGSGAASSGADVAENKGQGQGGEDEATATAEAEAEGGSGQTAASGPAPPASPSDPGRCAGEDGSTVAAAAGGQEEEQEEVELTVDEAADLLEFVGAARFIAQLIAEPVVSAGISAGRWSCTMRLAEQVRKLAEEEQEAQQRLAFAPGAGAGAAGAGGAAAAAATASAATSSLSNILCLGALADAKGLGMTMAQQARCAPALEAGLKRELRLALRRGQGGLKRRIRHRLQQGAPDVFSFPMVVPACQLAHQGLV